jgi:ABC-2 type transport system permease protein
VNREIAGLTLRQLMGQKRTLLVLLLAAGPLLLAVIYRLSGPDTDQQDWTANGLLAVLVVGTLLPLCALIFGTAALGSEIEDGTAVYLLSKPIPRFSIVVSKMLVAWLATAAIVLFTAVAGGLIALQGTEQDGIVLGFAVGIAVGSLVYTALFVMLSLITSRALITGLIYVFIWESLVTRLFRGTRIFSIREYIEGIADGIMTVPRRTFEADLGMTEALVLSAAVLLITTLYSVRRLERFEIGESG